MPSPSDRSREPGARRLEARLHGRVQGVGFRHFASVEARRLGATGFVRNEPDGSVTVVAEGPEPALRVLLAALRQGPPGALVRDVQVHWDAPSGQFAGFGVRWA